VPALLDLYRVGDDRPKPQNALVDLTSLVEGKCRETNVGKSSVTHGFLLLVFGTLMTSGDTSSLVLGTLVLALAKDPVARWMYNDPHSICWMTHFDRIRSACAPQHRNHRR
jgi:hypothetical protein